MTAPEPMMILRLEDGTEISDPSDDQIVAALDFLRVPGNTFAVLSDEAGRSLYAERADPRLFRLRRSGGPPEEHFRAVSEGLDLDTVREAFLAVAGGRDGWERGLEWQPDFFAVLADPQSPHHPRLREAARTLLVQVMQTFGRLPPEVPWERLVPLADRMARRVAHELADEEARFRPYRKEMRRDVRAAILEVMRNVKPADETDDTPADDPGEVS